MELIADLFGKIRTFTNKGKVLDERTELVAYFAGEMKREHKVTSIRLAHYSLSDLYALKSAYKDRLQRNGKEPAIKYLWAITRTTSVPEEDINKYGN